MWIMCKLMLSAVVKNGKLPLFQVIYKKTTHTTNRTILE